MNVVIDGLMTNYQKLGNGSKTLLFLHGWGDSAKTFSKLIEGLQDDYCILTLDLPGFGGTQSPPSAWGLEDYAEFINHWLKKIDAGKIDGLVGHSYGGSIAIVGLANNNLSTAKLVLIASAGIRNKNTLRKKSLKLAARVGKLPLYLLPQTKRRAIKSKFYTSIGSDVALLPHMETTFKRMIGHDVRAEAANINVPTLIIYGDKDKDTPPADGQIFSKSIKKSRLQILPGGHFIHQEKSQELAALIQDFLRAA
jgi:pimeloyl-ACP methyl ester carboxylesterase